MRSEPRLSFIALLGVLAIGCAGRPAGNGDDQLAMVAEATQVLGDVTSVPEKGLPRAILRDAAGIAVIPRVWKAGLVVSGRHGRGVMSIRGPDGVWTNPTFIAVTGGGVGFQAGVQKSDIVLVFKNSRSVDGIVDGAFTLGADASVAAGPVGRQIEAATTPTLNAEIYSYSRSRGLFAGVALDGAALSIDHTANELVYGAGTTSPDIFESRVGRVPRQVVDFRDAIEEQLARQAAR